MTAENFGAAFASLAVICFVAAIVGWSIAAARNHAKRNLDAALALLETDPDEVIRLFKDTPDSYRQVNGFEIYQAILHLLELNPTVTYYKTFVLRFGRIYLGSARTNGKPTIYDEKAIQNDIIVRAK